MELNTKFERFVNRRLYNLSKILHGRNTCFESISCPGLSISLVPAPLHTFKRIRLLHNFYPGPDIPIAINFELNEAPDYNMYTIYFNHVDRQTGLNSFRVLSLCFPEFIITST